MPASSASYHFFALIVDAGLIPFYIFTAMADKTNFDEPPMTEGRWGTLLKNAQASEAILSVAWLVPIVVASLHLLSLCICFYLVRMFRKIANLPPDMNPLEENLTSRRKSKHKHKNSEMTASEKHDSAISLGTSGRMSPTKAPSEASFSPVAFYQTRNDSELFYSPHNPRTAEASRNAMRPPGFYHQSAAARGSFTDLSSSRPTSTYAWSDSPPKTSTGISASNTDTRTNTNLTHQPSVAASSTYTDKSGSSATSPTLPTLPRKSSKRDSGTFTSTENWYAINDDHDTENVEPRSKSPAFSIVEEEPEELLTRTTPEPDRRTPELPATGLLNSYLSPNKGMYEPVRQSSHGQFLDPEMNGNISAAGRRYAPTPPPKDSPAKSQLPTKLDEEGFEAQPLHMNPPTPPPPTVSPVSIRTDDSKRARAESPVSVLSAVSGNERPTSARLAQQKQSRQHKEAGPISGPPTPTKGRYYGDLYSAMNGIGHSPQSAKAQKEPGHRQQGGGSGFDAARPKSHVISPYVRNDAATQPAAVARSEWEMDGKGRVVSRSGAELGGRERQGEWWLDGGDRRVSGKAAEEGRGGVWARRRISGRDG